jgi:soluble lytic murein transglycosylase-like protein
MNAFTPLQISKAAAAAAAISALIAFPGWSTRETHFTPTLRLSGIGVERERISEVVLAERTRLMIETQTFGIMRDPEALEGARRITSPALQKIFKDAERRSGLSASLIEAIAYLESWGKAKAESPAGPKGIMQIAEGTGRRMGLKIIRAKRYRIQSRRAQVRLKSGKRVTRTVRCRIPYTVTVRDDRFVPARAVPAAAVYLANLERKFGGLDWAVFAYHCGEGCTSEFLSLVRESGFKKDPPSVAEVFFGASPAHNQRLYEAIRYHMERDYSPTYWFRIMRAQQLLAMYKKQPKEFAKLREEYRNRFDESKRAPHRLSVWLNPDEISYQNCEDIRRDVGTKLVRAMNDSGSFGFQLRTTGAGSLGEADPENRDVYLTASPHVLGALMYISFETRRLHEALNPRGERFVPLEVTALVRPVEYAKRIGRDLNGNRIDFDPHCTGQVFAISYANLPPRQRECLNFILDDLGWMGYLGFIEESPGSETMQIGSSPSSREFFATIYEEARER